MSHEPVRLRASIVACQGRILPCADLLSLAGEDPHAMPRIMLWHPSDHTKYRSLEQSKLCHAELLLVDAFTQGKVRTGNPTLEDMRARRTADVEWSAAIKCARRS